MSTKNNIHAMFASNREDAENGKWFDIAPGVRLKIRRANSDKSADARRKLEAPYAGRVPRSVEKQLSIRHIAQGIVCGWEGLEVDGAVLTNYDADIMEQLLTDYADLRELVATIAMSENNFRDEAAQTKN